jgi:aspartyl-tRNA(Asn)/glutamyl-tRNA(Gln) amidotransferase subunit A
MSTTPHTRPSRQGQKQQWPKLAELVRQIKNGQRSAVEVVETCIERAEAAEEYRGILKLEVTAARERAEQIDQLVADGETEGVLLGVPFLAKDNFLTSGQAETTAASHMLEAFAAPYQATAIEKLEAAGAIMLGKTNLDEFAHGSSTENSAFGPTKNPYDPQRVPGGSSGGSAAAVALDVVPFALGTDTGGSIRLPASFCGTVGYKPTYGLVSRFGVIAMASSTDVIGPLTRSSHDAGYVLDVLAGRDGRDSTTIAREETYHIGEPAELSGLRVGVIKEHMGEQVGQGMRSATREKIKSLERAGARVEEVELPHDSVALAIYYIIAPAEISSNLARYDGIKYGYYAPSADSLEQTYLQSRGEGFGDEPIRRMLTGTFVLSSGYQDAYYKKAQKVRTLLREDYETVFGSYDVLAGPMSPTTAFKLGEKGDPVAMYQSDDLAISANLAGIPSISVPAGEIDGLPFGLQLQAPAGQDKRLLDIAAAVEEVV